MKSSLKFAALALVAAAIFANRATFHLWPFVPPRWATLSDALVEAVRN